MQGEIYSSDNSGNRVSIPGTIDPVPASGIVKTLTTTFTNYTVTVEAGERYSVVAGKTGIVAPYLAILSFSITGSAASFANKEWAVPMGEMVIIKIPEGVTTLNMTGPIDGILVYLSKLK